MGLGLWMISIVYNIPYIMWGGCRLEYPFPLKYSHATRVLFFASALGGIRGANHPSSVPKLSAQKRLDDIFAIVLLAKLASYYEWHTHG